jgi:hypothetical protein
MDNYLHEDDETDAGTRELHECAMSELENEPAWGLFTARQRKEAGDVWEWYETWRQHKLLTGAPSSHWPDLAMCFG